MQVTLSVEGMSCEHCVATITRAVGSLGARATVDLSRRTVTLEFEEDLVSLTTLTNAIVEAGYEVCQ